MPKPGPRTTPRYSAHFKATAVRLSQMPGVAVQDVAQSLYIHPFRTRGSRTTSGSTGGIASMSSPPRTIKTSSATPSASASPTGLQKY